MRDNTRAPGSSRGCAVTSANSTSSEGDTVLRYSTRLGLALADRDGIQARPGEVRLSVCMLTLAGSVSLLGGSYGRSS